MYVVYIYCCPLPVDDPHGRVETCRSFRVLMLKFDIVI